MTNRQETQIGTGNIPLSGDSFEAEKLRSSEPHFQEGILSDDTGDTLPYETTDVSSPTDISSRPNRTVDALGPTLCVRLNGTEDDTSKPTTLLSSGEWKTIEADARPKKQYAVTVETGLPQIDLLHLLPTESEQLDENSFLSKCVDYFNKIFDEIENGMSFEDAQKEMVKNILNPFLDYVRNPRVKIENVSQINLVFSQLKNIYQLDIIGNCSDEVILQFYKDLVLPVISKILEILFAKRQALEAFEKVLFDSKERFRKRFDYEEEDQLEYDCSMARNVDELKLLAIELLKKHAYLLLANTVEADECSKRLNSCRKRTIESAGNIAIKQVFEELECKVIDIVNEEQKKLDENRKKRNSEAEASGRRSYKVEYTANVVKTKPLPKKSSLWKKAVSLSALLFTLTASVFTAKDSCNSMDDLNSDLILMKNNEGDSKEDSMEEMIALNEDASDDATESTTNIPDDVDDFDFEMVDVVEDSSEKVDTSDFEMVDVVEDSNENETEDKFDFTAINEEWERIAESDIFDFTTIDETSPVKEETKLGLSVFQEEILPGDGMYKFLNKWKEIRDMRNVAFPEYFDDFSDFEIMTALAIFSDAEAKRIGDSAYKPISKNLMLRSGRNLLIPEDAAEILDILTGNIQADSEEAKIMNNLDLKGFARENTKVNYEAWRQKDEIADNDDNLIPIEIDEEWSKTPINGEDNSSNLSLAEENTLERDTDDMTDDLIPICLEENVADDLIPIDQENLDDLIPIDIDLEWENMIDIDPLTLADETNKKLSSTMNEIDLGWLEMDDEEDAELEMALNAMIK
ncbi:MAG: hypothetical protein RBS56_01045 [Candidatus Gracilibacteria bacterium]|jgi:hypothetical protein|nr:hypothetical protein [Candidatus Gracilibacteria bacterium]